ncbi:hypothetical protein N752_14820 [Desulforamulus aquiferis]|nr:hypothetical protein N752_14820 [Desulforamulus aquiferis]
MGKGTELLAQSKVGDIINLMGPLGKGFTMPLPGSRVAVAAGVLVPHPWYF